MDIGQDSLVTSERNPINSSLSEKKIFSTHLTKNLGIYTWQS